MNVWFGTSWGAPICESTPQILTPVGYTCLHCAEPIAADDTGIGTPLFDGSAVTQAFYHIECWMRLILGSVGHQLRLCPCFGGTYEGESAEMSPRDRARAAWDLAQSRTSAD